MSRELQEIEELGDQVARLTEVVRAHNEYMRWFKSEADKLVKSAGPLLAMAAPMLAQAATGQLPGVPTPPETPAQINGGFDG